MSRVVLLFPFFLLFLGGSQLFAQESNCADCHFGNPQADPDPAHLRDWESSAHGRELVGCDKCHGGDPTTFESFLAHRGILASRNPASPTHRRNLPRTCGACHTGAFVAFQRSRHFELLEVGANDVPTCSTCHGPVGARLLSPRRLEASCESCHGVDGINPQEGVALEARVLLEEVMNVRAMLDDAAAFIDRVDDSERRRELQEAWEQAEVPLLEAVRSGHAFVFDPERERLRTSRERVELLLTELVNPQR